MTAETLDTQIIARIHEALDRHDRVELTAELTEDVACHQIPGVAGAPPTIRGRDEVLQNFDTQMQLGEQRIAGEAANA